MELKNHHVHAMTFADARANQRQEGTKILNDIDYRHRKNDYQNVLKIGSELLILLKNEYHLD